MAHPTFKSDPISLQRLRSCCGSESSTYASLASHRHAAGVSGASLPPKSSMSPRTETPGGVEKGCTIRGAFRAEPYLDLTRLCSRADQGTAMMSARRSFGWRIRRRSRVRDSSFSALIGWRHIEVKSAGRQEPSHIEDHHEVALRPAGRGGWPEDTRPLRCDRSIGVRLALRPHQVRVRGHEKPPGPRFVGPPSRGDPRASELDDGQTKGSWDFTSRHHVADGFGMLLPWFREHVSGVGQNLL